MFKKSLLHVPKLFRLLVIAGCMVLYVPVTIAQDTIVKRNNEKIVSKILEVNPTEIKYKRFDYQDGPVFTLPKWELNYIVYGNGVKESFSNFNAPSIENTIKKDLSIQPSGKFYYYKNQKIQESNMLDIAWKQQDPKVNMAITQTEKMRYKRNCFLVGGIVLAAGGILTSAGFFSTSNSRVTNSTVGGGGSRRRMQHANRTEREKVGGYLFLGGIACEAVSIVFKIHERQDAHIVVDLYNKTLPQ